MSSPNKWNSEERVALATCYLLVDHKTKSRNLREHPESLAHSRTSDYLYMCTYMYTYVCAIANSRTTGEKLLRVTYTTAGKKIWFDGDPRWRQIPEVFFSFLDAKPTRWFALLFNKLSSTFNTNHYRARSTDCAIRACYSFLIVCPFVLRGLKQSGSHCLFPLSLVRSVPSVPPSLS